MAVIAALLRIYIQYLAFPLWQTGAIVQYLAVGEGSGYQGRHVEGLFRLCLTSRSTEVAQCGYAGIINPYNLRRCFISICCLYQRFAQYAIETLYSFLF